MTTYKEALGWATTVLKKQSQTPSLDADVLLMHSTGDSKAYIYGHSETVILPNELQKFRKAVQRRVNGEPVAYITGEKEFYGKTFRVTPDVLVPRPETEFLVEAVLDEFDNEPKTIADIGTGSGVIAITLKWKAPRLHVMATDISAPTLAVARENAQQHAVDISFYRGNLVEPLRSKVDGIVANLPYLAAHEMHESSIAHEPERALLGGDDGLDVFHAFFQQAPKKLKKGGVIFLEIGSSQAEDVKHLAKKVFKTVAFEVRKDLAGMDRVLIIRPGQTRTQAPNASKMLSLRNRL